MTHINDAPRIPLGQIDDGQRLLLGEGAIDLVAYVNALKKAGYDGPVSLEVFNADLRKMPPIDAAKKAWDATRKALAGTGVV